MNQFSVVPAAYVIVRRPDEVLLQLRMNTGYMDGHWACAAAGHVEQGESVLAAACREAAEELGIAIEHDDLEPLCTMHRTKGDGEAAGERVDFFFAVASWSGTPRIAEVHKAAELAWFPLVDLPERVVPHERFVLDRLLDPTLPRTVTFGF